MKNHFIKTALLAIVAGAMLWSCSGSSSFDKSRYIPVQLEGEEKWSILDTESGELVCENDFSEMPSLVVNDMFVITNIDGNKEMYNVNDSKTPLNKEKYSQLLPFNEDVTFAVKKGKGIMLIDRNFEVIKTFSDKYTMAQNFIEGKAVFCKEDKWGYMNTKGEEVIPAKFDVCYNFLNGVAFAQKGSKLLMINDKGETIRSFNMEKYSFLSFMSEDGYVPMSKGDKVVFVDKKGEELPVVEKMKSGWSYKANDGKTVYSNGDEMGLMTLDGEILVRAKYRILSYASPDRYIASNDNGKYGVIDSKGEEILPFDYDELGQISTNPKHYFAKEGSSYILIDEEGKEISKDSFNFIMWGAGIDASNVVSENQPASEETTNDWSDSDSAAVSEWGY